MKTKTIFTPHASRLTLLLLLISAFQLFSFQLFGAAAVPAKGVQVNGTNGVLISPTNFFGTNSLKIYQALTNAGFTFGTFDFASLTNIPAVLSVLATNNAATLTTATNAATTVAAGKVSTNETRAIILTNAENIFAADKYVLNALSDNGVFRMTDSLGLIVGGDVAEGADAIAIGLGNDNDYALSTVVGSRNISFSWRSTVLGQFNRLGPFVDTTSEPGDLNIAIGYENEIWDPRRRNMALGNFSTIT